jgi:hypothetical protein
MMHVLLVAGFTVGPNAQHLHDPEGKFQLASATFYPLPCDAAPQAPSKRFKVAILGEYRP